jgi:hypothetical protein
MTLWPDHLVRVLGGTAILSEFGLANVMLCSLSICFAVW